MFWILVNYLDKLRKSQLVFIYKIVDSNIDLINQNIY